MSADEQEHFGYEVEYATYGEHRGEFVKMTKKCNHPAGRDYTTAVTPGGNEEVPVLRILDEDDEEIAAYNGGAWIAIRKNARAVT